MPRDAPNVYTYRYIPGNRVSALRVGWCLPRGTVAEGQTRGARFDAWFRGWFVRWETTSAWLPFGCLRNHECQLTSRATYLDPTGLDDGQRLWFPSGISRYLTSHAKAPLIIWLLLVLWFVLPSYLSTTHHLLLPPRRKNYFPFILSLQLKHQTDNFPRLNLFIFVKNNYQILRLQISLNFH